MINGSASVHLIYNYNKKQLIYIYAALIVYEKHVAIVQHIDMYNVNKCYKCFLQKVLEVMISPACCNSVIRFYRLIYLLQNSLDIRYVM